MSKFLKTKIAVAVSFIACTLGSGAAVANWTYDPDTQECVSGWNGSRVEVLQVGDGADACGHSPGLVAIGEDAESRLSGIAIGNRAESRRGGVALGTDAYAEADGAVAVGENASAGPYSVALGYEANVTTSSSSLTGGRSLAIFGTVDGNDSVAIGRHSEVAGPNAIAIGRTATASGGLSDGGASPSAGRPPPASVAMELVLPLAITVTQATAEHQLAVAANRQIVPSLSGVMPGLRLADQ